MEYCARKLNFGGATLIRLLKCKDYRMSLNFIMTLMDALIVHQIKYFVTQLTEAHVAKM